jgi:microcystin-dependent protein
MSSYTKSTDFASKDALLTGNPLKVVKGTEIDDEFNAIQTAINSKADLNSPALTGTPTAPTASAGTNTTQLATCAFVLANGVPSGMIAMWSGVSVPSGWYLCDGTNGTPNLTDRFVVGSGNTYSIGDTGGSADAVVVSHTHTITDPGHSHTQYSTGPKNNSFDSGTSVGNDSTGPTSTETTGISINSSGESGTNKNLPPYYALAYIMKA